MDDDGGESAFEASTGGVVGNTAASAAVPKEDGPAEGPWLSTWHQRNNMPITIYAIAIQAIAI